jgi:hypothetical protein
LNEKIDSGPSGTPELRKDELELALLREQLLEKRRQNSWHGRLLQFLPVAAGVTGLIAGVGALWRANSDAMKALVELNERKLEIVADQGLLERIRLSLKAHEQAEAEATTEINNLRNDKERLEQSLGARRDALRDSGRGVDVRIDPLDGDDKMAVVLRVDSFPQGRRVTALTGCEEDVTFPSRTPDPRSCRDAKWSCQSTPCELGPVGRSPREDLWVVVEFGTEQEVRYVNLKSQR